ncbi:class I SAM-dependent methyltransferase [Streptomyces sp. NPDC048659]|uniref:class I SAM-dependent methyltransferase n=1 Tax=Streptomyces sp. NPDC048659 TaxID=3155489 RepID=UPI00343012FE
MTDLSAAHAAAVTDRARLTGSAYDGDRDLAARQAVYRWQQPRYDLPGLVAERLRDVRGRVVDVGCGNGMALRRLRRDRPDLSVLGLDLSPGMVAALPGPVAVADATRLPLAEGSADAALALHMLYHVPDIPGAVRELDRVVARDGLVVVSTNAARDKAELDDLWQRAAGEVLGVDRGPSRIPLGARFPLEAAPALLGERFARVEVTELPATISVPDPEPVVAYLASYRAWADQHAVPFDATIERARALLADHIARHGSYEITCRAGILVCRK